MSKPRPPQPRVPFPPAPAPNPPPPSSYEPPRGRRHHHQHHQITFPRELIRFDGLQGGQSGYLALVAESCDVLEIQLGADFVELTRSEADDLGWAINDFLELDAGQRIFRPLGTDGDAHAPETVVMDQTVEVREEIFTTERSPSSPSPAPSPGDYEPRRRGRGRTP